MTRIIVLRLGHRRERDKRISTHVGLVARAFGADEIVYSGEHDQKLLDSVNKVALEWGGSFKASYDPDWRKRIKEFKGTKVHLTMYGIPFQQKIKELKTSESLLVIVGGEKVPSEVYELADYNLAVTNQPHSEVAALGVFLHEYGNMKQFTGARKKVVPSARGKKIVEKKH